MIEERSEKEKYRLEHSEQLLLAAMESIDEGLLIVSKARRVLHSNTRFLEIWNIPEEIAASRDDQAMIDSIVPQLTDPETFKTRIGQIYQSSEKTEDWAYFQDDRIVAFSSYPVFQDGEDIGRVWISRDVTTKKRSEDRVIQYAKEQRAILEALQIGLCLVMNRYIQWINPAFTKMFGYEGEELCGVETSVFYSNLEDYRRVGEGYAQLAGGKVFGTEALMKKKDGTSFWCAIWGQALNPADLEEGSIWVLADITERKRVIQELREREERYRTIVETSAEWIWEIDLQGTHTFSNQGVRDVLGYRPEEILGMNAALLMHEDDRKIVETELPRLVAARQGWRGWILRWRHKNGTFRYLESNASPVIDAKGELLGYLGADRDVTERHRAEEVLLESEQRFKRLVQNSNDIICTINTGGVYTSMSGPVEKTLGYSPEELIGKNGSAFIHPDDQSLCQAVMDEILARPGRPQVLEFRFLHKNGSWAFLEAAGTNLLDDSIVNGIVMNIRNIAERKTAELEKMKLQEQLQQAMKMEAIGRLAGGIAHDFNNLLTAISGNVELARIDLSPSDPLTSHLEEIHKAAGSAASLTRQLLAFSRRQIIEPKVVSLNDLIGTLQKMLVRIIGEDIELQTRLSEDLGSVRVDPGQFEQVLINLAVNARDAMPNGGKLYMETANRDLEDNYISQHFSVQLGKYVLLAISDTGHGMSEEVKEHLFEPFFTTKPKGRGTGLGLATIFGTVKQSGGSVEVYSEVGTGTTFKIYLPRIEKQAEKISRENPSLALAHDNETVLVVEDNDSVRELATIMLKRLGYKVLQASNGEEAFLSAEKYKGKIDLLMTDVVMPEMNGRELAERMHAFQPGVKVLFTSGYTEDVIVHHGVLEGDLQFIAKPYSLSALAQKIREILDHPNR